MKPGGTKPDWYIFGRRADGSVDLAYPEGDVLTGIPEALAKELIKDHNNTPETCREALDLIDQMFLDLPKLEAEHLWDVLTALRGRDESGHTVREKIDSTGVVRMKALPRSAELRIDYFGFINPERDTVIAHDDYSHFQSHLIAACHALNIPIVRS